MYVEKHSICAFRTLHTGLRDVQFPPPLKLKGKLIINKNDEYTGVIYILTNPSFPQYVKIGYADDVHQRIKELNKSESIPYAFRLYAYYKVKERLQDLTLHNLIDSLNPDLRTIENNERKKRVREFYSLEPYEAYRILNSIAKISFM